MSVLNEKRCKKMIFSEYKNIEDIKNAAAASASLNQGATQAKALASQGATQVRALANQGGNQIKALANQKFGMLSSFGKPPPRDTGGRKRHTRSKCAAKSKRRRG